MVFPYYSQQRLSFSESFLGDAIYRLSLLVVCLSYSLLSFPQKCILGLSFLGDPSSRPCFKSQWEEISKAEMWGQCVTMPCLHKCHSVLPFLLSPAARGASCTRYNCNWRSTYHFTSTFDFYFFLNGLCKVKYNAVKSFLPLNNGMLHFISLHL